MHCCPGCLLRCVQVLQPLWGSRWWQQHEQWLHLPHCISWHRGALRLRLSDLGLSSLRRVLCNDLSWGRVYGATVVMLQLMERLGHQIIVWQVQCLVGGI